MRSVVHHIFLIWCDKPGSKKWKTQRIRHGETQTKQPTSFQALSLHELPAESDVAAKATCLGCSWGGSRANRHRGAFSGENILQMCQLCCSAPPAAKHTVRKWHSSSDTSDTQLCRPALLRTLLLASLLRPSLGSGQSQLDQQKFWVKMHLEQLSQFTLPAWGAALDHANNREVLLAQPAPPNTLLLQFASKTPPMQSPLLTWVAITLACPSDQAKQRVQN